MYPAWLTPSAAAPSGGIEDQLMAAQRLVPEGLLADSGLADDLTECADDGYHHFWMNSLQDVGWFAQENGRDGELPQEFWLRVATAASMMDFPEFVPYCLGKARGLPRQDIPDVMAAFATMPAALGAAWRQQNAELAQLCDRAAEELRVADPDTVPLLEAGDLKALRTRLVDSGALERAAGLGSLMAEAFDGLIACATAKDFPEERAAHAWAVIATNPYQVVLSGGLYPGTQAEVWWRAS